MNIIASRLFAAVLTLLIASATSAQSTPDQSKVFSVNTIRLEVFVRSDSETSKKATEFASDLAARTKGLEVVIHDVLVNTQDRRKILLIAGTFVVVSGLAYFAFMAAWLNLFLLIGIARPAQIALGLVALVIGIINLKDFLPFKRGVSLSIPELSKPGIYKRVREIVAAKYLTTALVGVVALAVIVNRWTMSDWRAERMPRWVRCIRS